MLYATNQCEIMHVVGGGDCENNAFVPVEMSTKQSIIALRQMGRPDMDTFIVAPLYNAFKIAKAAR